MANFWAKESIKLVVVVAALLGCQAFAAELGADADAKAETESQDNGSVAKNFGGPNAVPNQIEEDRREAGLSPVWRTKAGEAWDTWKGGLKEDHGFGLGLDYTAVYFNASDTFPGAEDSAAAGNFRLYGDWELFNRGEANNGALIWKVEHRHDIGDTAPSPAWAPANFGYIGLMGPPFNDSGFRIQNLYWRQRLADDRFTVVAGTIDVTDFVDVYGLASPWLHFSNFTFSTGSAAMDLPNDGGLGFGFGAMITDNYYFIGSIQDANGDPEKIWDSYENFFSDNEYFTSAELGWVSGKDSFFMDNYHVTLWHKDERENYDGQGNNKPSGKGVSFSFSRFVNRRWNPFLRGGWSDDGDSLLEKSLSVGTGYYLRQGKDLLGAGLNWGEPNPNQGAPDQDQYSAEVFYRLHLDKRINFTADVQYIKDPAANPFDDAIWVLGARLRIAY